MTAFLAGLAIGISLAMWIRWDQVTTLKEELSWMRRRVESVDHVYDRNRRWRGIYRQRNRRLELLETNPKRTP